MLKSKLTVEQLDRKWTEESMKIVNSEKFCD